MRFTPTVWSIRHLVEKNVPDVPMQGLYKGFGHERTVYFALLQQRTATPQDNSCQGATVSSHQAFAGTAPNLVRRGIPAVIAMQYNIWNSTAKLFADEFYRKLAIGLPVDTAIQKTRNTISMEIGLHKRDFATPVLYMRAKDGIILQQF